MLLYNIRSARIVHSTILSFFTLVLLGTHSFAQGMYGNQAVYTDADTSGNTIHAWGMTYAPSGNSMQHQYSVTTTATLPSGASSSSQGNGYGYNAARADVYISVPESEFTSEIEGEVLITSNHVGQCTAGGQFLNFAGVTIRIGISSTVYRTVSETLIPGGARYCHITPDCTNAARCVHPLIYEYGGGNCSTWYRVGYLRREGNCKESGAAVPWVGPGFCW